MKIETVHFGLIEINELDILDFAEGIPGFESVKRFILLGKDNEDSPFFWLQSVDRPEICFVVTDPFTVYNNYIVDVEDDEVETLEITDENNILILCIVVIPENIFETRVNLRAPILINIEKKKGKQVLQRNDELPIRYYLKQQ